jgi:hypothetical protein
MSTIPAKRGQCNLPPFDFPLPISNQINPIG